MVHYEDTAVTAVKEIKCCHITIMVMPTMTLVNNLLIICLMGTYLTYCINFIILYL